MKIKKDEEITFAPVGADEVEAPETGEASIAAASAHAGPATALHRHRIALIAQRTCKFFGPRLSVALFVFLSFFVLLLLLSLFSISGSVSLGDSNVLIVIFELARYRVFSMETLFVVSCQS